MYTKQIGTHDLNYISPSLGKDPDKGRCVPNMLLLSQHSARCTPIELAIPGFTSQHRLDFFGKPPLHGVIHDSPKRLATKDLVFPTLKIHKAKMGRSRGQVELPVLTLVAMIRQSKMLEKSSRSSPLVECRTAIG